MQVETYLYIFSVKILIKRSECAFVISKINVCFSRDSLSHPFVSKSEIPKRKDQIKKELLMQKFTIKELFANHIVLQTSIHKFNEKKGLLTRGLLQRVSRPLQKSKGGRGLDRQWVVEVDLF